MVQLWEKRNQGRCQLAEEPLSVLQWSGAQLVVFLFYLDYTEQTSVSVIFLYSPMGHVRATLFGRPAKLFVSVLVASLCCSCLQVFFASADFSSHSGNYTSTVIITVQHVDIICYILLILEPVCPHGRKEREKNKNKKENSATIGFDPIRISIIIIKLILRKTQNTWTLLKATKKRPTRTETPNWKKKQKTKWVRNHFKYHFPFSI